MGNLRLDKLVGLLLSKDVEVLANDHGIGLKLSVGGILNSLLELVALDQKRVEGDSP